MLEALILAFLSATAFVSTNLDNLLALTALSATDSMGRRRVMAGYWLALGVVVFIALGFSLVDQYLPRVHIQRLGYIPLAVGFFQLIGVVRGRSGTESGRRPPVGVTAAFALFVAMSADSVAVLVPLVADSSDVLEPVVLGSWLAMGVLWTWLSVLAGRHPAVARAADRAGAWVAPLLMMAVGVYILLDTPTDIIV